MKAKERSNVYNKMATMVEDDNTERYDNLRVLSNHPFKSYKELMLFGDFDGDLLWFPIFRRATKNDLQNIFLLCAEIANSQK